MPTNKKSQSDYIYPDKFNRQVKEKPAPGKVERSIVPRYDPKKDEACVMAMQKIRKHFAERKANEQ